MPGAMPQNHAQRLREQQPLSTRAKLWIGAVMALLVAGIAVAILLTTGGPTRLGCVDTYLPGVIGAQTFDECGADARRTCSTVKENEAQYGTVGQIIVEKACRKGHLSVS
jgi:hypothetical protein